MNAPFQFSAENRKEFADILKRYPEKRAAMLPTLHLVQRQLGYVSVEAEEYVAQLLEVPVVDVHEVVSFYTLFFRKPMGRHHIRLCKSISCWIRGCDDMERILEEKLGVKEGEGTSNGQITWESVPDCLGACELAPMLQLDGYFEGPLTADKIDEILARTGKQE